jgi:putative transposase
MIRTFRYQMQPTREQEATLISWLSLCGELYNAAIQERRDAWKKRGVSVGLYDQFNELTELREADPEWASVPHRLARSVLVRVERAYRGFFRRVKRGEKPGYPRFRASSRYRSFGLEGTDVPRINGSRVRLPKLGFVRFKKYRELRGEVRSVHVRREAGGWFISFVCDLGDAPAKVPVRTAIGIDVGLESLATLSTGEQIANPRFFREMEAVVVRRERALARTQRGSISRRRARNLVTKTYARIRNQRLDYARKVAALLFSRFDLIAYEELAIARMVRGNLAKSIYDAAWGILISALTSKAEEAGKWCVPVDPRGTSQRCSGCGSVVPKDLSQREHRCDRCGLFLHRDENAARNVLALGLSAGQLTEASSDGNRADNYAGSPTTESPSS